MAALIAGIKERVGATHTIPLAPMTLDWMSDSASDEVLEQAFDWLCDRRRDYSPHQDVWDVRWRWDEIKPQLQQQLPQRDYRLGPVQRFGDGEDAIEVW